MKAETETAPAPLPQKAPTDTASAAEQEQRIRALLSRLALFADLDSAQLALLASATQRQTCVPGDVIARRGQRCNGMSFVIYGSVQLVYNAASGSERTVRLLGAGASFGEASLFSHHDHITTATALADTLMLHVHERVLSPLIAAHGPLAQRLIAHLSHQLYMAICDFGAFTTHSGPQRLIGFLLRESATAGGQTFTLDVSKRTIASRLNLTPAHFSRILQDLSQRGLLRVNGRQMQVLDTQGLQDYHLTA
ncbi:MAG: Crp/Fnr family transcriptional regulator [Comamonas sp.]|nr:Crp/Fnr family transcriptional regulator [Comamonas sp.]